MSYDPLYDLRSHSPNDCELNLYIPIGASGAVGTVVGKGATVAKNTTGIYDITLGRGYPNLVSFSGSVLRASGANLIPVLRAVYDNTTTTLQFYTIVDAGTATEPSSGDVIMLRIVFNDSGLL